jgi:hypothetical protein
MQEHTIPIIEVPAPILSTSQPKPTHPQVLLMMCVVMASMLIIRRRVLFLTEHQMEIMIYYVK